MMNETVCADEKISGHSYLCGIKCISWSAIFLGAVIGFGLTFLLNLLALSIGLSAFTTGAEGNTVLAVSGFVGLVIIAFVSMFIAGWISGSLGRMHCTKRHLGELYGFGTWSVVLLLTILLGASMGQLVSHYSYMVDRNMPSISYTTHEAAPVVTEKKTNTETNKAHLTVNVEKATNMVGQASFVIFFLFFIGAIGSMFGGRWGMSCTRSSIRKEGCSSH